MANESAAARRVLDQRFLRLKPLIDEPRPHRGWVRAIRDALGMSGPELATRMGLKKSTIGDLERSEKQRSVGLDTLDRAADALGCEVVYFLVPRTSLEDQVRAQARAKAGRHLGRVAHHGRLEDQELTDDVALAQLDRFAVQLMDRRGLWSVEET